MESSSREQLEFRISSMAKKLQNIGPRSIAQLGMLGIALGALYCFREALRADYKPDEGSFDFKRELAFLMEGARLIESGLSFQDQSGPSFYNSGLIRIAILNEQVDGYLGQKLEMARILRHRVNRIKHEPGGVLRGRHISYMVAMDILEGVVQRLAYLCHG